MGQQLDRPVGPGAAQLAPDPHREQIHRRRVGREVPVRIPGENREAARQKFSHVKIYSFILERFCEA